VDFSEDRVYRCGPYKGLGIAIIIFDELIDLDHQFFYAAESSATDGPLGDAVEPDFH
jgi:hypothetical protein